MISIIQIILQTTIDNLNENDYYLHAFYGTYLLTNHRGLLIEHLMKFIICSNTTIAHIAIFGRFMRPFFLAN